MTDLLISKQKSLFQLQYENSLETEKTNKMESPFSIELRSVSAKHQVYFILDELTPGCC